MMAIAKGLMMTSLIAVVALTGCVEWDGSTPRDGHANTVQDGSEANQSLPTGIESHHKDDASETTRDQSAQDGPGHEDLGGDSTTCSDSDPAVPPQPPRPERQRVQSHSEIVCPSHFLIESEGTGVPWNVPQWTTGQWWHYRVENHIGETQCEFNYKDTVTGTEVHLGIEVYLIRSDLFECDGSPIRTEHYKLTLHSLTPVDEDGFVAHDRLFPLKDAKQWVWLDHRGQEEISVAHDPDYLHQGTPHTAWRLTGHDEEGIRYQWWSQDIGGLLREEIHNRDGILLVSADLLETGTP